MFTPESSSAIQSHRVALVFIHDIDALKNHLHAINEEALTGHLDLKIQDSGARLWSLYFEEGNLVWGDGGVHPIRRLHRQLCQYCSEEVASAITETANQIQLGNYESLNHFLLEGKIQQHDMEAIITGLITEIFFDLHQQWSQRRYKADLQLKFTYTQSNTHSMPVSIPLDYAWLQAMQNWQNWQHAELESCIPNHAPAILDAEGLQQQVLPHTYQNLVTAMDGKQTLRDLAAKSNRSLLTVTKSLLPYVQQGLVELSEIEDLKPRTRPIAPQQSLVEPPEIEDLKPHPHPTAPLLQPQFSHKTLVEPQLTSSLIAYIDDYKVDAQIMNQILTQLGYRFLHIEDPIQALPLLLEYKPMLIFLDLVMPIINGYETCAQIRRVSRFRDIPIIILTNNDGIVDRVRAKIVGSTGFLAKPIEVKKVQAALQKYLLA